MWREVAFGGTAALFLAQAAAALFHLRWARRLPGAAAQTPAGDGAALPAIVPVGHPLPRCTIVVPTRDEGARLEGTVRRLLDQQGVEVEIIVVDDRSTDGTTARLAALAAGEPRLRHLRVDDLPDGWLGKCHACHLGARDATGEWILFTDADCWLRPDVIARALRVAAADAADHVTLTPGVAAHSPAAQAWHLAFLTSVASWMAGVNRDRPRAYFGIGAFNLVRTSTYRRCGGYEALRLTVVDDVKLGLLLRRTGARTRAFIGGDDVQCQWGATVTGMFAVMEKNYFAAVDFRIAPVIALLIAGPALLAVVLLGPWTGSVIGVLAGVSPLALGAPALVLSRRLSWSPARAALAPFLFPVLLVAFLNSAVMTLSRGGVRWRDTFYPLEALRKGGVK